MSKRIYLSLWAAWATIVVFALGSSSLAREGYWRGNSSSDWNTAANWFVIGGPAGGFIPQVTGGINARAVIGSDNPTYQLNSDDSPFGSPVLSGALTAPKDTIGGIYLGVRERNFTSGEFINAEPTAGALVGKLTISAGTLSNISTTDSPAEADGRIYLGRDGRGFLTMTGGIVSATGLVVAGETIDDELGTSQLTLSGNASLTINGGSTLGRRIRIEGPNVNFNSTGSITLESTNTYSAVISSPSAHSPIKSSVNAFLGGQLDIQYTAAAPAIDAKWRLFDIAGGFAGNFTNVGSEGEVQVTGVPATQLGETYRLEEEFDEGTSRRYLNLVHAAVPVLRVNRDTGELSIRNPLDGTIDIGGYEINSPLGSLVSTYKGVSGAPAGDSGWIKGGQNSATYLAEVKQFGYYSLADAPISGGAPTISLGTGNPGRGFDKLAVAGDAANFGTDGEDLDFHYITETGRFTGHIEYIGTKFHNNLVLRVDPDNGTAFLKNDSQESVAFDGFSVVSSTGALSGTEFTAISGGGTSGTWIKSLATPEALSQTNLSGTTTLAPNAQIAIGNITNGAAFSAAAQAGLTLEFILAESIGASGAVGDYNADGIVDAADYTVWRNNLGGPGASLLNRDIDNGAGVVSTADYTSWKEAYGDTGGTSGPELTFRTGAVFFDPTAGPGSGGLAGLAVPEPNSAWLLIAGGASAVTLRRRRQAARSAVSVEAEARNQRSNEQTGGPTMWKHCVLYVVVFGLVAADFTASQALAAPQGIKLLNYDFEDPGPVDTKTIAYDAMGVPIAGAVPGWTFPGPGVETFGHEDQIGDSGVEGGGFPLSPPNNKMLLSTHDGKAYQIASDFTIQSITDDETYKIGFDLLSIFTIDADGTAVENAAELTVKLFYGAWSDTSLNLLVPAQTFHPTGTYAHFEFLVPHDTATLATAAGQSIGIEFDVTSAEFNVSVDKGWVGIDNVVMEIAPTLAGDLNGNGDIDMMDYAILRDNLQKSSCLTDLRGCPFEANGELTGNNVVNLDDFRAFKTLFASSGSGSGGLSGDVGGGSNVPEPGTWALSLLALLTIGPSLLRRRYNSMSPIRAVRLAFVGIVVALANAAPSSADLLVYDPFMIGTPAPGSPNYNATWLDPTNAAGGGQNPTHLGSNPTFFSGGWHRATNGGGPLAVAQADGLYYLDPEGAMGGSATVDRVTTPPAGATDDDARISRPFSEPWGATDATYYVSWAVSFGSMGVDVTDMGYRALEFWNETPHPNSGDADIWVAYSAYNGPPPPRTPNVARMHLHSGGGDTIIPNAPNNFLEDDGATHLVVFKFVFDDAPASDSVSVFLDPISLTEPAIAGVTHAGLDLTIGSLGFAMFGSATSPEIVVDELRIATTWIEALPPLPVPGDTDGDDDVDNADFATILSNLGKVNIDGGPTVGDVALSNGMQGSDRRIDLGDILIWKRNEALFGAGGGGGGLTGVPEPSSMLLALASIFAFTFAHRTRTRRWGS